MAEGMLGPIDTSHLVQLKRCLWDTVDFQDGGLLLCAHDLLFREGSQMTKNLKPKPLENKSILGTGYGMKIKVFLVFTWNYSEAGQPVGLCPSQRPYLK